MSLLSHLLRPIPLFFIGLAAIAAAEEPAPPPSPEQPPASAGWPYTKEQLAAKPLNVLHLNCGLLMKYNGEYIHLRRTNKNLTAAEISEHKKKNMTQRFAAWKELRAVEPSLQALVLDPETKALGTAALEIYKANQELDSYFLLIFGKIDNGISQDDPEVQALARKVNPLIEPQEKRIRQQMDETKRILMELHDAKVAAGVISPMPIPGGRPAPAVAPAPTPAPAPAKPGTITPAKKSSKDELPPGMTRK